MHNSFIIHSFIKVKGLHFVHFNICSLMPKVDAEELYIGILCLTETWLNSSITDGEINVNRYNIIRKNRNRKRGGGGYS